jgi:hypothetical protein
MAIKGLDAWLTNAPDAPDWDYDELRNALRELSEGRNLKTYWDVRQGTFHCPRRGDFVMGSRNGREIKTTKCHVCGKRHKVDWSTATHSRGCFDILSFDGKDADLDAGGCTGIKEIRFVSDESVELVIGGHKTVCPIGYEDDYTHPQYGDWEGAFGDIQQEIVCGSDLPGDWSGNDWTLYTEVTAQVEIIWDDDGEPDYKATARVCATEAWQALHHFREECGYVAKSFEQLWADCQKEEIA